MKAKQTYILLHLVLISLKGNSQVAVPVLSIKNGVQFSTFISWEKVKAKAKAENKYIFVDCFATWCMPCKKMDREVYSDKVIGNLVNNQFISVKVQMDTNKLDTENEIGWYADGHYLRTCFNVTAFPTMLFFSPDGEIIHEALGYKNTEQFSRLISDALDPHTQYFSLLRKYEQGEKNYPDMVILMKAASEIRDKAILKKVGNDYTNNYLGRLSYVEILSESNILLLNQFIDSSGDTGFNMFLKHASQIDSVMKRSGYSNDLVDRIIFKEELKGPLEASVYTHIEPDWKKIAKAITSKYNEEYVNRNIARARISWYKSNKDWENYTRWIIMLYDRYIVLNDFDEWQGGFMINNNAWEIYLRSSDKKKLKRASEWLARILNNKMNPNSNDPSLMDTYAHLQFKLHNTLNALKWEEAAAKASPNDQEIQTNWEKMKSNAIIKPSN